MLCVDAVSAEFSTVFAGFLDAGGYRSRERSSGQREFYCFHRPSDDTYPAMIEPFARRPETQPLPDSVKLSPIPLEEDVISLSAILLDDDYFEALRDMRVVIDGISLIDERILIPFKARAFLDLSGLRAGGQDIDSRHTRKHRGDVFRLIQLLPGEGELNVTGPIRADLVELLERVYDAPEFDYKALKLPITLADAIALLSRYYRLDTTD